MNNTTYSVLSEISGLSIQQLKRAAFALSPEKDFVGGRGKVREISPEEGFQMFLFGILVNTYKIKEGAFLLLGRILSDMARVGLWPLEKLSQADSVPLTVARLYPRGISRGSSQNIYPDPKLFPGGVLEFRIYERGPEQIGEPDDDAGIEKVDEGPFTAHWSPSDAMDADKVPGPEFIVPITQYLVKYLKGIQPVDASSRRRQPDNKPPVTLFVAETPED